MKTKTSPTFSISQKQKRLKYWDEHLSSLTGQAPQILEKLTTYRMLLSRLAKASSLSSKEDSEETHQRILDLERQIETDFEHWRLGTSPVGQYNVNTEPD